MLSLKAVKIYLQPVCFLKIILLFGVDYAISQTRQAAQLRNQGHNLMFVLKHYMYLLLPDNGSKNTPQGSHAD